MDSMPDSTRPCESDEMFRPTSISKSRYAKISNDFRSTAQRSNARTNVVQNRAAMSATLSRSFGLLTNLANHFETHLYDPATLSLATNSIVGCLLFTHSAVGERTGGGLASRRCRSQYHAGQLHVDGRLWIANSSGQWEADRTLVQSTGIG